jgi:hypothetical protein
MSGLEPVRRAGVKTCVGLSTEDFLHCYTAMQGKTTLAAAREVSDAEGSLKWGNGMVGFCSII